MSQVLASCCCPPIDCQFCDPCPELLFGEFRVVYACNNPEIACDPNQKEIEIAVSCELRNTAFGTEFFCDPVSEWRNQPEVECTAFIGGHFLGQPPGCDKFQCDGESEIVTVALVCFMDLWQFLINVEQCAGIVGCVPKEGLPQQIGYCGCFGAFKDDEGPGCGAIGEYGGFAAAIDAVGDCPCFYGQCLPLECEIIEGEARIL